MAKAIYVLLFSLTLNNFLIGEKKPAGGRQEYFKNKTNQS